MDAITLTAQGNADGRARLVAAIMAAAAQGDDVLISQHLEALVATATTAVVEDIVSDLDIEGHDSAADYVAENYR